MNSKILIALLFMVIGLFFWHMKASAQTVPLNMEFITNENVFYQGDPTPQPNVNYLRDAVLNIIDNSTTTLDIALYGLNSQAVVDALIEARNRGVRVRIVGHGEYATDTGYGSYYGQLQAASMPFVLSDGLGLMHNKFIIADGVNVLTGSTNFTLTGFHYNLNNVMVFHNDIRVATAYTCKFNEMFVSRRFGLNASGLCGGVFNYADGITVEILFTPNQGAQYISKLVNYIGRSDAIYGNWFGLTLDQVGTAMNNALASGTTIHAVFDATGFDGTGSEGRTLCANGANIKVENVGGKMHEKIMLFDLSDGTKVIWGGSANFSRASSTGSTTYGANDENTVIVTGANAMFDEYLSYFWRVFNELPLHTYCRVTSAENNIPACGDSADNDYDGYTDIVDFDCNEATLETCQDSRDNDGDGYFDGDDYGCWMINRLCPANPPHWLPPQVSKELLTLHWSSFEFETMIPMYEIYGSKDGKEWYQILATTSTSWQVPQDLPYQFIRLGGEGCFYAQDNTIEIKYPYVVGW